MPLTKMLTIVTKIFYLLYFCYLYNIYEAVAIFHRKMDKLDRKQSPNKKSSAIYVYQNRLSSHCAFQTCQDRLPTTNGSKSPRLESTHRFYPLERHSDWPNDFNLFRFPFFNCLRIYDVLPEGHQDTSDSHPARPVKTIRLSPTSERTQFRVFEKEKFLPVIIKSNNGFHIRG